MTDNKVDYVGTSKVRAFECNLGRYNQIQGWSLPEGQNPEDQGFVVERTDGSTSWVPRNLFMQDFNVNGQLTYGQALEYLKQGYIIARSGWNGTNMFIGMLREPIHLTLGINGAGHTFKGGNRMFIFNMNKGTYDPWVASSTDTIGEDWFINFDINMNQQV